MRLDHLLGHEEPQARAADVDLAAVLGPGEFLEEARQDFRRDADPGVFDLEYESMRGAVERERASTEPEGVYFMELSMTLAMTCFNLSRSAVMRQSVQFPPSGASAVNENFRPDFSMFGLSSADVSSIKAFRSIVSNAYFMAPSSMRLMFR